MRKHKHLLVFILSVLGMVSGFFVWKSTGIVTSVGFLAELWVLGWFVTGMISVMLS